jgi:hypothetical protein
MSNHDITINKNSSSILHLRLKIQTQALQQKKTYQETK